jgi:sulfatase maturation enzyme AslB (radical SAM superfamily)
LPQEIVSEKILPLLPKLKHISMQGGETTAFKTARLIRDSILENDLSLSLYMFTNGVRINDQWTKLLIKQQGSIHFSVNASNKEVYNAMIKYGDFDAVIANMKRILVMRKELSRSVRVAVSCVVHANNLWDIKNFFHVFRDIGVDAIIYYIEGTQSIGIFPSFIWSLSYDELTAFQALLDETISEIEEDKNYYQTELPYLMSLVKSLRDEREASTAKAPDLETVAI